MHPFPREHAQPEAHKKPYEVGKREAKQFVAQVKKHGCPYHLKLTHDDGATIQVLPDGSLAIKDASDWPYKRYYIQSVEVEDAHIIFHCTTNEEVDQRFVHDGTFHVQEWMDAIGYNEETRVRSFCLLNVNDAVWSNWSPF